jgi:acetyl-CoA acetyltransferase
VLRCCKGQETAFFPGAVTKLSKTHGPKVEDIGLRDLNEEFACQVLHCRARQRIDP